MFYILSCNNWLIIYYNNKDYILRYLLMSQANTPGATPTLFTSFKCIEDLISSDDFASIFLSCLSKKYNVQVFEKYLLDIKQWVSNTQSWQEIVNILDDWDFVATLIKQFDQNNIILAKESVNQEHITQIKLSIIKASFHDPLTSLSNSDLSNSEDVLEPFWQISSDASGLENDNTQLNAQDIQEIYAVAREKGHNIKAIDLTTPDNSWWDIPSKNRLFKINWDYYVHVHEWKKDVYTYLTDKNNNVDRFVHGEDNSKMIFIIDNTPYFISSCDTLEMEHKPLSGRPNTEILYFWYKWGINAGEQVVIVSKGRLTNKSFECFWVIMDNGVDTVVEREWQQYLISKNISPIMREWELYKQWEHELNVSGDVFVCHDRSQIMVYDIKNTKALFAESPNKDGTMMMQDTRYHTWNLQKVTDPNILDSNISWQVSGVKNIWLELFYSFDEWNIKGGIDDTKWSAVSLYDSNWNILLNKSLKWTSLINVRVACIDWNIQLYADQKRRIIPNKNIDHTLISIESIQEQMKEYQKETSS